ncbi:glycosyltransferase [Phenylobacterium sp.]|jgi:glycosyltransferase involved in cell wall biosynthesis|uniref:glycosyltransferase n=1 Tax=Phenylobacterium sp. TaxID=1871053 RepID=UPI002F4167F2
MNGLAAARALWRQALPEGLRRRAQPALASAVRRYVANTLPRGGGAAAGPVRVVGLFAGSHGIAAGAELSARALEALGATVERIGVRPGFDAAARLPRPTAAAAWIFHLNPPELPFALASLGPGRILGARYGAWAWELPRAPAAWLRDAALLDEVWVPSRYTAEALAGAAAPVRVTPHPVAPGDYAGVAPAPRAHAFQAVALFDFNSSMARKNPQGAIAAFARAFADDANARLTVKTQNGACFPDLLAALRAQAPANVEIVDETWPYARVMSLIAGADALVSLHRAEGFGLTLAEAMAVGTPVVATAFSGNLDFMDETCALLVPAGLTPVDDAQGIYRGQAWAEPDVDVAARALARLRLDAGLGRRLAEAARRRVADQLAPEPWLLTLPQPLQAAVRASRR